jgi:RNA polymerase sigma-70 factor (ECF subfamily)
VDYAIPSVQSDLIAHEEVDMILKALQQLSGQQQKVLHLVFYQEKTIEEAADILGISLGSARTHYQRGKERLKLILKRYANY